MSLLRRTAGFTLIELLVVILIIGILIAVSAPSFLGQTQKAHDSEAKQYLTVAYKAAAAGAVDRNGDYGTPAQVVADIQAAEPEISVATGSCPTSTDTNPKHIFVDSDPAHTGGDNLMLCNDPLHRAWTLTVINHALVGFSLTIVDSDSSEPTPLSQSDCANPANEGSSTYMCQTPEITATVPMQLVMRENGQSPGSGRDLEPMHGFFYALGSPSGAPAGVIYLGQKVKATIDGYPGGPRDQPLSLLNIRIATSTFTGIPWGDLKLYVNNQPLAACSTQSTWTTPCIDGYFSGASQDGTPYFEFQVEPQTADPAQDVYSVGYQDCTLQATGGTLGDIVYGSNHNQSAANAYNLFGMDASGANQHPLFTTCNLDALVSPRFSADHNKLLFEYLRGSTFTSLYTINADGTGLTKVADEPQGSISPDGSKVAYIHYNPDNTADVYTVSSAGGTATKLTDIATTLGGSEAEVWWALWAGNSHLLLVAANNTGYDGDHYYWLSTSGTIQELFALPTNDYTRDVAVSPDGSKAAVLQYDSASNTTLLRTLDLPNGSLTTVAASNPGTSMNGLVWSPNSDKVALSYNGTPNGYAGVFVWDGTTFSEADGISQTLPGIAGTLTWLSESTIAADWYNPNADNSDIFSSVIGGADTQLTNAAGGERNQSPAH
jgi:prepilin-type N-terminal cleavage/methylation domain-containing protein